MIFKQWEQVLNGTKTQTRRLIKPGEFASGSRSGGRQEIFGVWKDIHDLQDRSGQFGFVRTPLQILESLYRLKWHKAMGCFRDKTYAVQPGRGKKAKTYAVQPGRGKKAVGRIRITAIRRERVQDIRELDAEAEMGFRVPIRHFMWGVTTKQKFAKLWNSIHTKRGTRWEDNPEVWVLEFEAVE